MNAVAKCEETMTICRRRLRSNMRTPSLSNAMQLAIQTIGLTPLTRVSGEQFSDRLRQGDRLWATKMIDGGRGGYHRHIHEAGRRGYVAVAVTYRLVKVDNDTMKVSDCRLASLLTAKRTTSSSATDRYNRTIRRGLAAVPSD